MKNRKSKFKKCAAFLAAVLLTLSGILMPLTDAEAVSSLGTVTVAVERFTIGQGYLIEPYTMELQQGDTYETVCRRVLEENGYSYSVNSSQGFYLEGIAGADGGTIQVPSCIGDLPVQTDSSGKELPPPDNSAVNQYAGDNAWLGEFSYSFMSGWMYSVGNDDGVEFPGVGMDQYKAQDGDVFRLQFTLWGYGTDLLGYDYAGERYYDTGNKTELTRRIALINQDKEKWFAIDGCRAAYEKAVQELQELEVSQKELDKALAALPDEEPILPESVTLDQTSVDLTAGDSTQLVAEVKPDNVNRLTLTWSSANPGVAQVDKEGKVTAVAAGETDISVTTQNGKQASCHVTVQDRYIEKIILNMAGASLERDESFTLSVKSYEPANATEVLAVTYESSDSSVASVDEDGLVTAVKAGRAEITVKTRRGVSAVCEITVGDAEELARAIEEKIEKLPDFAEVNEENAREVMNVWEEFSSLSEKAQSLVRADAVDKLKKSKEEAEKILEKLERIARVNQMLSELPAPSVLTMADGGSIEAARGAYKELTQEEKGKVDASLYAKLLNLERALEAMKQEIDSVREQVEELPEVVTLADADAVLVAWDDLQSLSEEQLSYLGEEVANRLNDAADQLLECIKSAVADTDATGIPDFESEMIQSFLAASNACEAMDDELAGRISQDTWDLLQAKREWIGEAVHGSGQLSITAAWFLRLSAEDEDVGSEVKKEVKKQFSSLASVCMAKKIQYEDVRDRTAYEPEKAIELTADLSESGEAFNHPIAVTANIGEDNKITLKELDTSYNAQTHTISFKTNHQGLLLILDAPIDVTGIDVQKSVTVGQGETLDLSVAYTPYNATIHKDLKFKSSDSTLVEVDEHGTLKGISPGSATVTVSLKSDASITAKCKVTVTDKANDLDKSVRQVLKESSAYMLSIDTNPTIGSEWFVLGLARSQMDLNASYFSTYYNHIANYLKEKDGKLTDGAKYTEYSKMILIMTAIGKDARDIAGYNLLSDLADFSKVSEQGFNGPVWALIALNSKEEYAIPEVPGVVEQTTREKLINYILGRECSQGGWALTGDAADSDITGMALQALAPFYRADGYEAVTQAIDRALNKLSSMQIGTGGYGTMNAETSESAAQVLTGLCALGIDPQTDSRFIKNGHWLVENLMSYHIEGSGFMHVKAGAANNGGAAGGEVNGMATEQGYYALTAYQRFLDGKTALYDMSDLSIQPGEEGDGKGTGVEDPSGAQTEGGANKGSGGAVKAAVKKAVGNAASDAAAKKEGEENPWSFDGDAYTANLKKTGAGDKDTGDAPDIEKKAAKGGFAFGSEAVPYVLCVLCGAAVVGMCIYFKKLG